MNLSEKILTIYPELQQKDFMLYVILQNDLDGSGDYIAEWKHPTLQRPTDEQLAEIN